VTLVSGSILVSVDALAICLVVLPRAFINVAVGMPELSEPVGLILLPHAFVASTIRPGLLARAVTLTVLHVAAVECSVFKLELTNELVALIYSVALHLGKLN